MLIGRLHSLFCVCAVLIISITVPAQSLPELPRDERIQSGTLRCGVPYYMVSSSTEKGFADFALVRAGIDNKEFEGRGFLARSGVSPRRNGYGYTSGNATILRFDHVPVYDPAVLDSMLLISFASVAALDVPQAFVICGDIDAAEVRKKMDIFSMLVPRRNYAESAAEPYIWRSREAPSITVRKGAPASVRVSYFAPRVPAAQMNTTQALVSGILGEEFLTILRHRIEQGLQDERIPYGDINCTMRRSSDAGGDERYSIEVTTAESSVKEVESLLARTLASLDVYGAKLEEFTDAKRVLFPEVVREAVRIPSNSEFADKCIAHFLYGADLAPSSEKLRFFARKNLSDTLETQLFNNFSAALLDPLENLSLRYAVPKASLDETEAVCRYYREYLYGEMTLPSRDYSWRADTIAPLQEYPRVKLRSEKADPVSGGTMWTFSNGIRVIYRQFPGTGYFTYALVLSGGLAQIRGLEAGEGAYIGDMFPLYQTGGLSSRGVRDMLAVNGISMDASADQNTLLIRGDAPADGLQLLMNSLLGIANSRSYDNRAFETYVRNTAESIPSVDDRLFAAMHPDEKCAVRKDPKAFSTNTRFKAEALFEERFSRLNEGVIVLAGDLDPAYVKKLLARNLGGFRVSKNSPGRKTERPSPRRSAAVDTLKGSYPSVELRLEADYSLTGVNYYATSIAAEAMRRHLVGALAEDGVAVRVDCGISSYPQERLWMRISCFPAGVPLDMEKLLRDVRSALPAVLSAKLGAADLKAWKNRTLSSVKAELGTPKGVVDMSIMRYGAGKDLVSHYADNIAAIDAGKINDMLSSLIQGGKSELIVE